jgi:hypothetical protein
VTSDPKSELSKYQEDTTQTPLVPKSESVIEWQGKSFATVELEDPIPFVSIPSFCRAFGLDVANQRKRINRRSWYADCIRKVLVTTPGGKQANLCLRVDALPTFMLGVGLENIPEKEDQALFKAFMDESSAVLAEYWGLAEMGELRFLREQMARMEASHLVDQEGGLPVGERLDRIELMIEEMHNDVESRLETMRQIYKEMRADYKAVTRVISPKEGEARIGDPGNEELLADVKTRVDLLARLKTVHFREERPYPHIWNYVNMSIGGVTTYKKIPVSKFQAVIDWLDEEILAIEKAFPSQPPEN